MNIVDLGRLPLVELLLRRLDDKLSPDVDGAAPADIGSLPAVPGVGAGTRGRSECKSFIDA
jgi:hypothetical protein